MTIYDMVLEINEKLEQVNQIIDDINDQIEEGHKNDCKSICRDLAYEARGISSLLMDLYYQD